MTRLSNLIDSIDKLNNVIGPKKTPLSSRFAINNLPNKYNIDMIHYYRTKMKQEGKYEWLQNLNTYNLNDKELLKKGINVYYANDKWSSLTNTNTTTLVSIEMESNTSGICRINIDPKKSIFIDDSVYENEFLNKTIESINGHPCKVTRIGNSRISVEILTSKPINQHDFVFISNTNLNGKSMPQFKSKVSILLDEKIVDSIDLLKPLNEELCHNILTNNQISHYVSEESFFHYENKTQYSSEYCEYIEYNMMQSYDYFNKLFDGILVVN